MADEHDIDECGPRTVTTAPLLVLSSGSSTGSNFWPLTDWMGTAGVRKARATVEMRSDTGICQITPAYQVANDTDAPGAITQLPNGVAGVIWLGAEGIQYQNTFNDLAATLDGSLFVRFGVSVRQDTTNSEKHGCLASLRVDIQGP